MRQFNIDKSIRLSVVQPTSLFIDESVAGTVFPVMFVNLWRTFFSLAITLQLKFGNLCKIVDVLCIKIHKVNFGILIECAKMVLYTFCPFYRYIYVIPTLKHFFIFLHSEKCIPHIYYRFR